MPENQLVPTLDTIAQRIIELRGHRVMLDTDLAEMYGVPAKALNQAVKRNAERFPEDFMFRLTKEEKAELVTNCDRFSRLKHSTVFPCAFTEQGVAMLSSVLNSARAVQVNVAIMRAFVQLRGMLASHAELSKKLSALEQKYDAQFKVVFEAIRELMEPPKKERRKIGF
jgi:hypothetical protein